LLIIYRTQDADEVRRLRTAMPDGITQNASVKVQLTNLKQDLEAMQSAALKALMQDLVCEILAIISLLGKLKMISDSGNGFSCLSV
jgi:hypothetical protein